MDDFWTIPIASMVYTRWQNYTNMVAGGHGIQTLNLVVVVRDVAIVVFI